MKTIKHFKFPEQANNLYKNEASSTIALSKLTADKINEMVDVINEMTIGKLEKDQEQDGKISKAVMFMKDNLINSIRDLMDLLMTEHYFRDAMDSYLEKLALYTELCVEPSGEMLGDVDVDRVQEKLDTAGCVILTPGKYYFSKPLNLKSGQAIIGKGVVNTTIECAKEFCIIPENVSCDNIIMSDFMVKGVADYDGIKLMGTTSGTFTGARYSRFDKLHIIGFNTCVSMRGAWCVAFNQCRFEPVSVGVRQYGTCNNIKYEQCQFLGTDSTATGLYCETSGGAENYTVTVKDCDFERLSIAVRGYCTVGLAAYNLHCESVSRIFSLDSCLNFICDGVYSTGASKLVVYSKSNESSLFAKANGKIKNVFMKMTQEGNHILCDVSAGCTLEHENIKIINNGSGKIYINGSDYNSKSTNRANHPTITVYTEPVNVAVTTNKCYAPSIMKKPSEQVKLGNVVLVATEDFTLDKNISVYVNNDNGHAFLIYVNAGTYKAGKEFTGNYTEPIQNLIDVSSEKFFVQGGTGASSRVPLKARLTFITGEMVV